MIDLPKLSDPFPFMIRGQIGPFRHLVKLTSFPVYTVRIAMDSLLGSSPEMSPIKKDARFTKHLSVLIGNISFFVKDQTQSFMSFSGYSIALYILFVKYIIDPTR